MKLKQLLTISITTLLLLTLSHTVSYAFQVSPHTSEFTLNSEDSISNEVSFTNNTEKVITINTYSNSYDPKTGTLLKTTPFVQVKEQSHTLSSNDKINIPYTINIPSDTPEGTYFNIVVMELDNSNGVDAESYVTLKNGFGALIVIHVIDTGETIDGIFTHRAKTTLEVLDEGLTNFFETTFQYTYTNTSDFVFKPEGEIKVLDQEKKQVKQRFEINPEKKTIYPGESITEKHSVNIWNLGNVLGTKDIVSETYSGYGNQFVTNSVSVTFIQPIMILIGIAILLTLIIIWRIRTKRKSSK